MTVQMMHVYLVKDTPPPLKQTPRIYIYIYLRMGSRVFSREHLHTCLIENTLLTYTKSLTAL
jgi:hypothetical protein